MIGEPLEGHSCSFPRLELGWLRMCSTCSMSSFLGSLLLFPMDTSKQYRFSMMMMIWWKACVHDLAAKTPVLHFLGGPSSNYNPYYHPPNIQYPTYDPHGSIWSEWMDLVLNQPFWSECHYRGCCIFYKSYIYMYMCVCVYVYIYIYIVISYICIYIYICVCVYAYVFTVISYIYIYICNMYTRYSTSQPR